MRHLDPSDMADMLGALGHPDRLRLLLALDEGARDVSTLSSSLRLSQPRTSQHLRLLAAHGLVTSNKEGRRVFYELAEPELLAWLEVGGRFVPPP